VVRVEKSVRCVSALVSDIAIFVLKRDVKLQPTNRVSASSYEVALNPYIWLDGSS